MSFTVRARLAAVVLAAFSAAALTVSSAPATPSAGPAPEPAARAAAAGPALTTLPAEPTYAAVHKKKKRKKRKKSTSPGFTLIYSDLLGYSPAGLNFWVDKGAQKHKKLAAYVRSGVASLRASGVPATYRGWGTPALGDGVVTVTVGPRGCGPDNRVGNTYSTFGGLTNGDYYVYGAEIAICPSLWKYARWQWVATAHHEMGHAAGLAHTNTKYRGHTQLMNWRNTTGVTTFKAGDKAGLRLLASHAAAVRAAMPTWNSLN